MNHSFDVEIAKRHGINAAVVFNLLQIWISHNASNAKNKKDGKTWTYNTVKAWACMLPYFTDKQVRTALDDLLAAGLIIKANHNENHYDRTLWYALADETPILCPEEQKPLPLSEDRNAPGGKTVEDMVLTSILEQGDTAEGRQPNQQSEPEPPKLLPTPRPRNLHFDALCEIDGTNPEEAAKLRAGQIAQALKQIKTQTPDVTPEEIRRRASNYRKEWPSATLTACALAKHWARFHTGTAPISRPGQPSATPAAPRKAFN